MRARGARIGLWALMVVMFAMPVPPARAELTASGDLFVNFSGAIDPVALPRNSLAPISVQIGGTVRTLSGEQPPALRGISIAISRGGRLNTYGLPVCHRREIEVSNQFEALKRCGDALVGSGGYEANTAFPEQGAFPSRGEILAFNTVIGGQRAILAHVYATDPVPITRIVVFKIHRGSGSFGTVLSAELPEELNRWGYLTRISLGLHREYAFRGRERSYLSAACRAPAGFPGAVFPFAEASMDFSDGRVLTAILNRSCRVKDG